MTVLRNTCFLSILIGVVLFPVLLAQKGVVTPGEASKKEREINPAFAKVVDDPALPRVLIIGDSISIGYTAGTRKQLAGIANVHRIPGNAGHTGMGLANLEKWLDEKKGSWDLIHFNWGLWDLCYRHPKSKNQGNRDKVKGAITHTPEKYAANLEEIVTRLKKTGAILIFATTTPVPKGEAGRKVGDDNIYNKAAQEVMKRHRIKINDLHGVVSGKMDRFGKKPGDVHFTPEGSSLLADAVAREIRGHLKIAEAK
jgi:lysophospholipase L1-like esterase